MNIDDIKPYAKNAKKHPKKQIQQVADSITAFGFNQPIVVDINNVVIVGHGRLAAAQLLGLNEVPVITVDLTEEQAKAYRLADNKLNESEWDMKLVVDELLELSEEMFELTGFDKDLIVEPDARDDEVPETSAETVAQLGDVWELGRHRLMCGSATVLADVERLMDGAKADMVFTDPPYNVNYEGTAGKIQNDKQTDGNFYQFLYDAFTNMATATKRGAVAYICHADIEGLNFRKAFIESGFLLKSCIVWNKDAFVMGRADYHWKHEPILLGELEPEEEPDAEHEPILYGWQDGDTHSFYGGRKQSTVWDIPRPKRNAEHPTMKPVELITRAILNSSKKDDIVLDLFAGSGSTLIASEKTGRVAYLMELDPKFVDVIIKRYEQFTGQKAIKSSR